LTKEELGQYKSLKREIELLEKKLDRLHDRSLDVPVVAGKVSASSKDFPYTPYRVGVLMDDPEVADDLKRLIRIREQRLEKCRKLLREIEEYIDGIEDSETRMIFQYRFIDGMKLKEISKLVNLELSAVSVTITRFLKCQTNQKNTCYNLRCQSST
jgi:DNA-directed RNA polymerase specialized sigma24 family protein